MQANLPSSSAYYKCSLPGTLQSYAAAQTAVSVQTLVNTFIFLSQREKCKRICPAATRIRPAFAGAMHSADEAACFAELTEALEIYIRAILSLEQLTPDELAGK